MVTNNYANKYKYQLLFEVAVCDMATEEDLSSDYSEDFEEEEVESSGAVSSARPSAAEARQQNARVEAGRDKAATLGEETPNRRQAPVQKKPATVSKTTGEALYLHNASEVDESSLSHTHTHTHNQEQGREALLIQNSTLMLTHSLQEDSSCFATPKELEPHLFVTGKSQPKTTPSTASRTSSQRQSSNWRR